EGENALRLQATQRGGGAERGVILRLLRNVEDRIDIVVAGAVEHPDDVVLVDGKTGNAFEGPFVRQRQLWPAAVINEFRGRLVVTGIRGENHNRCAAESSGKRHSADQLPCPG